MNQKLFAVCAAYLLAAVLLYAGIDKNFHYVGFVNVLNAYALLPSGTGSYFAAPVIATEIFVGIGLTVATWRRTALFSASLLFSDVYNSRES